MNQINRNYVKKHMDNTCKPKTESDKSKYKRKDKWGKLE